MACLGLISYQDFRERAVLWALFPIMALLLGYLHFIHVHYSAFFSNVLLNLLLTAMILMVLFLYTRWVSRTKFLDHSFGLGDLLFFCAMCFGFPSITFIVLFSSALIFSLAAFFALKKNMSHPTVPLAGLMGLFLISVFVLQYIFPLPSLYLL
jgi:hypothetical protein